MSAEDHGGRLTRRELLRASALLPASNLVGYVARSARPAAHACHESLSRSLALTVERGCEIPLLAVGPSAVAAADALVGHEMAGMRARRRNVLPTKWTPLMALVFVDVEPGAEEGIAATLLQARQEAQIVIAAVAPNNAPRVVALARRAGVPIVMVASNDFASVTQAIAAPWLVGGLVGIYPEDFEALFRAGRTAYVVGRDISLGAPFPIPALRNDTGGKLSGLLVAYFLGSDSPGFGLCDVDIDVRQAFAGLPPEIEAVLSVTPLQERSPYALVTALYSASDSRLPETA